jgi:membrane protein
MLSLARVTAVLFMIGKSAITFYIGSSNETTAYGTAGSLVIILLLICYSSLILYFGVEFTKAYATIYGGLIQPNDYAVWVRQVEVEAGTGSFKQHEQKKKEENKRQVMILK